MGFQQIFTGFLLRFFTGKHSEKSISSYILFFMAKWVKNLRCFQKIWKSQWQWKTRNTGHGFLWHICTIVYTSSHMLCFLQGCDCPRWPGPISDRQGMYLCHSFGTDAFYGTQRYTNWWWPAGNWSLSLVQHWWTGELQLKSPKIVFGYPHTRVRIHATLLVQMDSLVPRNTEINDDQPRVNHWAWCSTGEPARVKGV